MMLTMRVYSTESAITPAEKVFLSDEEYARALRKFVKFCNDVLVVGEDGRFYLPNRRIDRTQPGPWFVGGPVVPFVGLGASLLETVKREMGIEVDHNRFVFIGEHQYFFGEKDGIPHDAYCKLYVLQLTPDEIASVRLDANEYEGAVLHPYGEDEIRAMDGSFAKTIFLDLWRERSLWL